MNNNDETHNKNQGVKLKLLILICIFFTGSTYASNPQPVAQNCKVAPVSSSGKYEPALPMNYPDKFAWQLFTKINKKAKKQHQLKTKNGTVTTNSALWETWPDDPYTFPKNPNPENPPVWLGQDYEPMSIRKPFANSVHGKQFIDDTSTKGGETVHRNKATFDYVINNKLWYQQGLAEFFSSGQKVYFPTDAIEVKANWVEIDEDQKDQKGYTVSSF